MKSAEIKKMSSTDMQKNLVSLLKEQFNLRMQKGMGTMPKSHLFKKTRRSIARIKTLLNERERQS